MTTKLGIYRLWNYILKAKCVDLLFILKGQYDIRQLLEWQNSMFSNNRFFVEKCNDEVIEEKALDEIQQMLF